MYVYHNIMVLCIRYISIRSYGIRYLNIRSYPSIVWVLPLIRSQNIYRTLSTYGIHSATSSPDGLLYSIKSFTTQSRC